MVFNILFAIFIIAGVIKIYSEDKLQKRIHNANASINKQAQDIAISETEIIK